MFQKAVRQGFCRAPAVARQQRSPSLPQNFVAFTLLPGFPASAFALPHSMYRLVGPRFGARIFHWQVRLRSTDRLAVFAPISKRSDRGGPRSMPNCTIFQAHVCILSGSSRSAAAHTVAKEIPVNIEVRAIVPSIGRKPPLQPASFSTNSTCFGSNARYPAIFATEGIGVS